MHFHNESRVHDCPWYIVHWVHLLLNLATIQLKSQTRCQDNGSILLLTASSSARSLVSSCSSCAIVSLATDSLLVAWPVDSGMSSVSLSSTETLYTWTDTRNPQMEPCPGWVPTIEWCGSQDQSMFVGIPLVTESGNRCHATLPPMGGQSCYLLHYSYSLQLLLCMAIEYAVSIVLVHAAN